MPEEFTLKTDAGDIKGTIKHADKLVVFSHGFGVDRNSRGLFTDIASALPEDWGYVLFDYNKIEMIDNKLHVFLRGYTEQTTILLSILECAKNYATNISLVGHSMGCMTISLVADPKPNHVVLLAPPVGTTSGRLYFNEYTGAHRDSNNVLVIPRKDGTITHVPDSFWDDAEKYFPPDVYTAYAEKHELTMIQAKEEDVLKHVDNYELFETTERVQLLRLPGDHNFSGDARSGLLRTVTQLIAE
jgi:pimeloyl-ACP methyl ester carboxylesterase